MKSITILILLTCSLFFANMTLSAQNSSLVSGSVHDEAGESIIGASVTVVGAKTGTTDVDGNFSINAKVGDVLQFTYLGFVTLQHKIVSSAPIHITMKEDVQQMDEIVVVGYGVQKKVI